MIKSTTKLRTQGGNWKDFRHQFFFFKVRALTSTTQVVAKQEIASHKIHQTVYVALWNLINHNETVESSQFEES